MRVGNGWRRGTHPLSLQTPPQATPPHHAPRPRHAPPLGAGWSPLSAEGRSWTPRPSVPGLRDHVVGRKCQEQSRRLLQPVSLRRVSEERRVFRSVGCTSGAATFTFSSGDAALSVFRVARAARGTLVPDAGAPAPAGLPLSVTFGSWLPIAHCGLGPGPPSLPVSLAGPH